MKIVKFGAIWCPSCLVMKQRFNKVDFSDIDIVNYDYDDDSTMVEKYQVGSVLPVMILVDKDDNEVKRFVGEQSLDKLKEILDMCRGV